MSGNMNRIAKFEKVSWNQFYLDWRDTFNDYDTDKQIEEIYDNIKLPKRATTGAAGYDFYTPVSLVLKPNQNVKIPTGIRVKIDDGWVLKCYSRSGLGFKYKLRLANGTGIIDSDYYYAENEGHIFAKLTNESNENKTLTLNRGDGFMQGIFVEYGITVDDEVTEVRVGGIGSTSKNI